MLEPISTTVHLTDFVTNVTVRSRGKVIAEGTVNVQDTVNGIQSGTLSPRNVFRNDKNRLPSQPGGYYINNEYVHPTTGLPGPGPQRIVAGQGGELYYTPDHYETFLPLN
jgi:filamentous hemagglutinin